MKAKGYLFNGRFYKTLHELRGKTMSEGNEPQPLYTTSFDVKIDEERPKGLTLHQYWDANSSEERTETIERTFEYVEQLEKRLKSDKEKIENLREGVKTNSLLLDRNIELSEDITQLKAKAERDLKTANKNDLFYTNEIIRIERNSVSTEYLEETVLHYKEQIIKLKQEIEALKNDC